ncbi:hypothetical protein [Sandaracinus amylolyticus]|uniref:hypothetical protein n=1 Tax=Sandaracinus amylolyticus TaxID=927083 RepID=UPI001F357785|nr:hypothetical protein [Sandaracinus amylolyticus]UJR82251.1 Hypothetical protein I5071_43160 [Sandaracinus amylolyticus]
MSKIHTRQRGETRSPKPRREDDRGAKKAPNAAPPGGALMGRRVGRSSKDLGDVLKRPEKMHGDYPVDTSKKGISATDKKAGGESTARRNSRKNAASARYALEDSKSVPSRKSTRRSGNSQKADNQLKSRTTRNTTSPEARARRASVSATRTRGGGRVAPRT